MLGVESIFLLTLFLFSDFMNNKWPECRNLITQKNEISVSDCLSACILACCGSVGKAHDTGNRLHVSTGFFYVKALHCRK